MRFQWRRSAGVAPSLCGHRVPPTIVLRPDGDGTNRLYVRSPTQGEGFEVTSKRLPLRPILDNVGMTIYDIFIYLFYILTDLGYKLFPFDSEVLVI